MDNVNRKERRKQKKQEKRARRTSPAAKALLEKAQASLEAGNLDEAEKGFREVSRLAPLDAEAFHMRALIAYRNGRLDEAGEMILEAITRDDKDVDIHANCGAIMNLLGRSLEAEAACRYVVDLRPGHADGHNNLAVALELQGRLVEALESSERAIEIKPDFVEAHINRGNIKLRMDEVAEAAEAFRAAIKLDSENALALANLGIALREAGDLAAAEEECLKAIEVAPTFPEAHNSLGNVLTAKEDWPAAKEAFKKAMGCRAGYLDAHLNLAAVMFKAGDMDGAEAQYREILKTHEDLAEAHAGLGVLFLAAGHLEKAVESFREAVKNKPALGLAQYNLATAVGAELSETEITDTREVLADRNLPESERAKLHFALGEIGDQRGNWETAFADYEAGNQLRKDQLARTGHSFDADAFDQRVDRIISLYGGKFLDRRKGGGDASEQPVFIVGMPRSGTTLIEQIAASHAEVAGKGEMHSIRTLCGDDGFLAEADEGALAAIARDYLGTLRAGAEDALRITDKMPFNTLHLGQIQLLFPGARVIHCLRDPIDTGMSCFRQYFTSPHAWACDLKDIGRYQRATMRLMDHWRGALSLPMLDVRYEDLIADQEGISRE
ncbi:MAG: sulfotransferase, partial [Proteobacteria bacterium]|nr:sulfotransferase [Pseudomonadota bacterium]